MADDNIEQFERVDGKLSKQDSEPLHATSGAFNTTLRGILHAAGDSMDAVLEDTKTVAGEWTGTGVRHGILFLAVYLGISVALFLPLEGWGVGDCLYFAIVVVTTVGYGDLKPLTDASRLVTVFYVHAALVLVSYAIDSMIHSLVTAAFENLQADDASLFDTLRKKRRQHRFYLCTFLYLVVLLIGTATYATQLQWGEGNSWINGLYLTVITVTTVGFGDYSPHSLGGGNDGLVTFGTFLMLIGIPICVATFSSWTKLLVGSSQDTTRLKIITGLLTHDKFTGIETFVEHLRSQGIGAYQGQGKGEVSRFEYLCFMLVQNGVLKVENIKRVMDNFEVIDRNRTGLITVDDVVHIEVQMGMEDHDHDPGNSVAVNASVKQRGGPSALDRLMHRLPSVRAPSRATPRAIPKATTPTVSISQRPDSPSSSFCSHQHSFVSEDNLSKTSGEMLAEVLASDSSRSLRSSADPSGPYELSNDDVPIPPRTEGLLHAPSTPPGHVPDVSVDL